MHPKWECDSEAYGFRARGPALHPAGGGRRRKQYGTVTDSLSVMHEKNNRGLGYADCEGGERQLTEGEWTYQVALKPARKESFIILSNTPPTASRPIAAS